MKKALDVRKSGTGVANPGFASVKSSALKKRSGDKKDNLKKVHSSTEYCRDCGEKVSRSERYEAKHRHHSHYGIEMS